MVASNRYLTEIEIGPKGRHARRATPSLCRAFLDGEEVAKGDLIITITPRDGMLCTLGGKVVKFLEVEYNEDSGEIDEMHLEEVRQ